MNEQRLAELSAWRDVHLFLRRGDEMAAVRLRKRGGTIPEAVARARALPQPTPEELRWVDANGEPIDPDHHWWS